MLGLRATSGNKKPLVLSRRMTGLSLRLLTWDQASGIFEDQIWAHARGAGSQDATK